MTEASGIRVRPAVAEDLAAVLDLYAQPDFDAGRVLPLDEAARLFAVFRATRTTHSMWQTATDALSAALRSW